MLGVELFLDRLPRGDSGDLVDDRGLEVFVLCLDFSHFLVHLGVEFTLLLLEVVDGGPSELLGLIGGHDFLVDLLQQLLVLIGDFAVEVINFII